MIQVKKNRFHTSGGDWNDEDFYIFLGPNAELTNNPQYLIDFHQLETIGCIHTGYKSHLGEPIFSNDFIVFKNNYVGKHMYKRFMVEKDITEVLKQEQIRPIGYANCIRMHCDPNEQPTIRGTWINNQ
jgi:hypothetical protein